MKGAIWLSAGAWGLVGFAVGLADSWDPADRAPWHLQSVAISDEAQTELRPESPAKRGRPSYLHIRLQFRPQLDDRRLHQFRVVDKLGKTVADVHGFYRDRSVLVFEGEWKDLQGLYLEGLGHREPLVPGPPRARAEPPASPPKAEAKVEESPWEIDPPSAETTGHPTAPVAAAHASAVAGQPPTEAKPPAPIGGQGSDCNQKPNGSPGGKASDDAKGNSEGPAGAGAPPSGQGPGATEGGKPGPPQGLASRGPMGGLGGAGGGIAGGGGRDHLRGRPAEPDSPPPPPIILYLSCAEELGRGRIYQVDEFGAIRGLVTLPFAATGLALHHRPALVAVVPRGGGKILQIDAAGKVSVILENDPLTPQPVDVAVGPGSDAILVADRLAHVLATTSMDGQKAREARRFPLQRWDRPWMCVAVATDKRVLYSTDMEPGVYRFGLGDELRPAPLLARPGGVAADPASARWAAAQPPGQVAVFEGGSPRTTLRLPPSRVVYRQGLLAFAPADRLVIAAEAAPAAGGGVAIVEWTLGDGSARELFVWRKEDILDLVVGPRMPWPPYEPDRRRGLQ